MTEHARLLSTEHQRLLTTVDSDPGSALALVAVLHLHRPDTEALCSECWGGDDYRLGWPCKTVKTIAEALGVSLVEELPQ